MNQVGGSRDVANNPIDLKKLSGHYVIRRFISRCFGVFFTRHGNSTSILGEHRVFTINPTKNPGDSIFQKNQIKSSKYTVWNFVPKNLFEQFRRVANFYFLLSAIIAMSIESPVSPFTTLLPLVFVILVTACKQGYEDFLRHKSDYRVNCTSVTVIRNKCMQVIKCEQIIVGDLVRVSRDEDLPCDIILLYSSESNGSCYVTTSNLDGESNLKTLQVPKVTSNKPIEEIVSMECLVTCQHPLSNLYEFQGKIEIKFTENNLSSGFLTIDNILLRGSRLKDTEFIIGAAVYTGSDTKLSLNSKQTPNKFSTVEKSINLYLIFFIFILILEITISTILKQFNDYNQQWDYYLSPNSTTSFSKIVYDFLSFTILYNYIVPISLYVTVELQKFLGSLFFHWDSKMYDERNDQPALVNTSDLNEDLGQIEYLLTDKTGTLTENLMVFRRCTVDGKMYIEKDCNGKIYELPSNGNEHEAVKVMSWPPEIWHFMIALSLCHSVHVAPPIVMDGVVARRTAFRESFRQKTIRRVNSSLLMDPSLPEYQAASADEKALVEASARCGVILTKYEADLLEIKAGDRFLHFTCLETLEFTSERKRMSVIVQDSAGELWLYSKGADSEMFPLMHEGKIQQTEEHVADFSQRGLRTLAVGCKKLTIQEYDKFITLAEQARQTIGPERSKLVEQVYLSIETGMMLLGATGIEDSLQEGVEETLESLRAANIKVWVLTGDKAETAENIAFSCGHFKKGTEVLRLMGQKTLQVCFITLTSYERRMKLEPYKQYGLIMDGMSMAIAYNHCPELLRIVGMTCDAVVCCRMSPLQKSEIVQLIKNSARHPLTAAIGDGGNDVSMIQEAHVGIGIMGKEGRQASMNADFALAKFMFLKRALLIHGHWYYIRLSILTQYFFYKNVVFITPQIFFGLSNGFSSQALYDSVFLMGFNVLFTSLPVLAFGLLAQDYSARKLISYPQYYILNKKNRLLSIKQTIIWLSLALWHTSVIYFGTYTYFNINPINLSDNTMADYTCFNTCIFHLVSLVTNLELLSRNLFWTFPFVFSIIFSELLFFIVAAAYSSINIPYNGPMFGVFINLISSPTFWLLTIVIVPMCLIPDYLIAIYESYRPSKLNYQDEREENIQDNYSEWSTPSSEERRFNWTPWRGNFTFINT
ncbi:phospholipid-transporting ATPase IF isoform X1 [Microplitis demolitor]|uniref:phospholipid-transporting ATPase IF isoform X1 n=1 Tax=Microplitis demolitor TaxID=69319 RepID=UPI0004CD8E64|nr:phospholipid-transporting ATPase IF isoform X1 [Microplitis demolitor]